MLAQGQTISITPDFLTRSLDAGADVTVQSNDDIIVDSPIIESSPDTGGSLTLDAGRSILIDANIDTAGGNLALTANDTLADGVVDSERDLGNADITEQSGVTIDTGGGALSVDLMNSTDKTNNGRGTVTLLGVTGSETLSEGTAVGISINGTMPGDGVAAGSYTQANLTGSINLNSALLAVTHIAATSAGTSFTIIQTTAGVSGQFSGLPEGATVVAQDGTTFMISYQGNGGENVVLTQVGVAAKPGQLSFDAATYTATEGGANAKITVTRINGSGGSVTVAYATGGGTAVAGQDYTSVSGTLTFGAGVTSQSFTVPILNNGQSGGSETVNLALSSPAGGATLGNPASAVLTIQNSTLLSSQLHFSVASSQVPRTAGSAILTVVRTGGVSATQSVQYATSDGTAKAGTDYTATGGTLTFAPGVTAITITIPILNDGQDTGDKSLTLTLSNPTGEAVVDSPGTLTLTINDPFPRQPMPSNLTAVAGIFTHSSEAFSLFVTHAYSLYLKRLPDPQGLGYWVNLMQNQGLMDEALEANFLQPRPSILRTMEAPDPLGSSACIRICSDATRTLAVSITGPTSFRPVVRLTRWRMASRPARNGKDNGSRATMRFTSAGRSIPQGWPTGLTSS